MRRADKCREARAVWARLTCKMGMLSRFKRRPRPNTKTGTSELRRRLIGRDLVDATHSSRTCSDLANRYSLTVQGFRFEFRSCSLAADWAEADASTEHAERAAGFARFRKRPDTRGGNQIGAGAPEDSALVGWQKSRTRKRNDPEVARFIGDPPGAPRLARTWTHSTV